jgi:hypothetical protein
MDVFCTTLSVADSSCVRTVHHTRFAMPACVMTTPLGRPVDPDV